MTEWIIPSTGRTAEELCVQYGFEDIEAMRADVPEGGSILDVGAGRSNLLESLTEGRPDINAVAVDIRYGRNPNTRPPIRGIVRRALAPRQDIVLRRPTERVRFVGASALQLPFTDGSFQRVYSYYLLPWLRDDDYKTAVDEMIRVADQAAGKVMGGPYTKRLKNIGATVLYPR